MLLQIIASEYSNTKMVLWRNMTDFQGGIVSDCFKLHGE